MCKAVSAFFFLGLGAVLCLPLKDGLMVDLGGDTAVVESTVREARQAPEQIEDLLQPGVKSAFIHTYGNKEGDKGGVHGFSKKLNDRANDGYSHFDSFHKKDADKYGFEIHSEVGKSDKANVDVADENGKFSSDDDKKDGQETKTLYAISGESKEGKKNKNFLDDFDFVYFGDGAGISKYSGGGGENENEGGTSQGYQSNESYESGGSSSYDSGDKNEADGTSSKSQSLKAEGDEDEGESHSYGGEEEKDEEEY